jgi:Ca2+-binding EF-hand superfamily protein
MQENKLDSGSMLKRIGAITTDGVKIEQFATFLKQKVEKSKGNDELLEICKLIDIDKDGYICSNDLYTCIKNLDSEPFYKDGGKAL